MVIRRSLLVASLVTALATVALTGCSQDERRASPWSCNSVELPMGETVRCTQEALEESSGTTDSLGSTSSYDCSFDGTTSGCPGAVTPDATGSATGAGATGSSGDTSDDSSTTPGESGTTSTDGDQQAGKGRGRSARSECDFVEGCDHCGGTTDGAASGGEDDRGSSAGSDDSTCESGGCGSPGQKKKNQAASGSGAGTTGATTGQGPNGNPTKAWHCTKDADGSRVCDLTPTCGSGSHPSACGACVPDGEAGDCVAPSAGGCWVTGGGFIVAPSVVPGAPADGHDNFGGNAKPMKDGRIQGHWNHVDHGTGNHAKGKPSYLVCRHVDEPGPGGPGAKKGFTMNQVYFGGPAEWRDADTGAWAQGYWFDVVAKDHGEPGSQPKAKNGFMVDTYHFTVRKVSDAAKQQSGSVVYETKGDLQGGNIQMHPPSKGHPYTPGKLPGWVSYEP